VPNDEQQNEEEMKTENEIDHGDMVECTEVEQLKNMKNKQFQQQEEVSVTT
jgi:hypothetical protein